MRSNRCDNFNHRRPTAPVRCCPQCGDEVNSQIGIKRCHESEHAEARRQRNAFCVHCGEELIK